MGFEDMVIAHAYLSELGDEHINALLDLLEDQSLPMTARTWAALYRFLKNLEHELGEDHPAVLQIGDALSLPPRARTGGRVFKNAGMRIS